MSYLNVVYFPLLMRVLTSKCPTQCPTLLKYIMHIQDSFKKKPEFKDFPLLRTLQTIAIVFPDLFCPPAGLCG